MATKRLTDINAIDSVANEDVLHIVDTSDTTDNPAGSSKKVTAEQLKDFIDTDVNAEWGNITGSLSTQTDLQNILDTKLEESDIADFETTTQLNARDTANRARANHTGVQAISTVTGLQSELDSKATDSDLTTHVNDTTNPHEVTKTQVGLGNVDNTSDLNKPISTATQDALDLKINLTEKGANSGVATLDSGGKIPATQLPSTVMEFKGTWNASTNTPTLANGTGDTGDVYLTSTAGTVNFGAGNITFAIGDWVVYNGSIWEKSTNSNAVVSVNGQQGVVSLDTDDISDTATNRYTNDTDITRLANTSGANTGDQNLQEVTDNGSTTTNSITANSFIKSGGVSTEFLKADGSSDSITQPAVNSTMSTGIIFGGALSINAGDTTKIDISAGAGYVVDDTVVPATLSYVSWDAFTAVTLTDLATEDSTDIAISSAGAVVQQRSYTNSELRSNIFLGGVDHTGGTVRNTFSVQVPSFAPALSVRDLARAVGDLNISGNTIGAASTNLTIAKTSGQSFSFGRNTVDDKNNPHIINQDAVSPITFEYIYQDGAGGTTVTAPTANINPLNYDDGDGTLGTVGVNDFAFQNFLVFPNSNKVFVQYGTVTYNTLDEAINELASTTFPSLPGFTSAMRRGVLIVKRGTTDLTDTTDARFFAADKFGSIAGSVGTGVAPDLSVYVPYTGATGNVDLGANDLTSTATITGEQLTSTDQAQIANELAVGTTSGKVVLGDITGNARGTNAIDIQSNRSLATTVASGLKALAFGRENTASGDYSTAIGVSNTSSGKSCSAFGLNNNSTTGESNFAAGVGNSATGSASYSGYPTYAIAIGGANTSSGSGFYGSYSSAIGVNNTASGYKGSAFGFGNTAGGNLSTSVGNGNSAGGNSSVAIGSNNNANFASGASIGVNNFIGGVGANSIGSFNRAEADNATAIGYNCTASTSRSSALGSSTQATGIWSSGSGYNCLASGNYSTVSGYRANATGNNASVFGSSSSYEVSNRNEAKGNFSGVYGNGKSKANFDYSFSFGHTNVLNAVYAFALGANITNATANSVEIGASNTTKIRVSSAGLDLLTLPLRPATLADASAPNNSVYYSSTASKLVYKDSAGVVNNLY